MRAFAVSALLLLAGPVPAAAAGVDLKTLGRVGFAGNDSAELAVVGDVNGDGRADLASSLQSDLTDPGSTTLSEVAVVAFGGTPADPRHPAFAGWVVSHLGERELPDDRGDVSYGSASGGGVAGVGDWDGDGLADVALGAAGASAHGRPNAGAVYVVLGRGIPGPIDVRTAPGVIRIDGPRRGAEVGRIIAPAGDVDGDGRPDLVIALPGEEAVIVRGGLPAGTTLDLAAPAPGTTIPVRGLDGGTPRAFGDDAEAGPAPEAAAFVPVGDVDGDGRGELLVGLPAQDPLRGRGRALVLRGVPAGGVMGGESALTRVVGPRSQGGFGRTVATVPDSDGDGRPEWLLGAADQPGTLSLGGTRRTAAYAVFSRARGVVAPGTASQPVVTITTTELGADAGRSVAGIPDRTGDGVPDLLIGLPRAAPGCRGEAGAIVLVPGRRTPGTVRIGRDAPRVDGPYVGAELGSALAPGPDGLLVGTVPYDNSARLDLWRVGLEVFGAPSPALPARDDCLQVQVARRTRAQLLRNPTLRVRVRSDAGDDRAHALKVELVFFGDQRGDERNEPTLRLPRTTARRFTVRLPRRALEILREDDTAFVGVLVQQVVGRGVRASSGNFGSGGLAFRRR